MGQNMKHKHMVSGSLAQGLFKHKLMASLDKIERDSVKIISLEV